MLENRLKLQQFSLVVGLLACHINLSGSSYKGPGLFPRNARIKSRTRQRVGLVLLLDNYSHT